MAVEINVDETPAEVEDETGVSWESALLEVSQALRDGFSQLRQEYQTQLAVLQESNSRLLESNTQLLNLITQNNQTMMERLSSLIPTPSQVPAVVVVETPAAESDVEESQAAEISEVEESPAVTRQKRRTL